MMKQKRNLTYVLWFVVTWVLVIPSSLFGLTLTVQEPGPGGAAVNGYRWLVEEDTTTYTTPGALVSNSISLDIHNSYAPVVSTGRRLPDAADPPGQVTIDVPADKRYIVSVMPDEGHAMSGKLVDIGQTAVTVVVNPFPIPTAQITVLAFEDHNPINNAPDATERGLEGFTVVIADAGGQQMKDAFNNMLGTTYQQNPDGSFVLVDGAPVIATEGLGYVLTDASGRATIKYLAPGKYGVQVIPPDGSNWVQTATIEGTKVIDAWVKANEPANSLEGFGVGFYHCFFGYVDRNQLPWVTNMPVVEGTGAPYTGSISGTVVYNHFSRPPTTQGFHSGPPVGQAWVGLNDAVTGEGLLAMPCNPDTGYFEITDLPDGTYQLVTWDENLDSLFGFHTVVVPPGLSETGDPVALGDVLTFRWFGTLEGTVFEDNGGGAPDLAKVANGFRDPGEPGIPGRTVNLRFRDGTIYQTAPTDMMGNYSFEEVFPFFKWLVVEVDFANLKDTGMTAVVDDGGAIPPDDGWNMPSRGALNPQPQAEINTNTGNNLSRTQVSTTPGEVLLQAMHLFLNQTNIIDWGKIEYDEDSPIANGGITGVVFYDTTRAENDPRYCAGEPWQPGIPRVQVALYQYDWTPTVPEGTDPLLATRYRIEDLNGDGAPTLADVDNYPFGWLDGSADRGPEDVDRDDPDHTGVSDADAVFNPGDALQIVTTDCWDDNKPTGSRGSNLTIHGDTVPVGFDGFGTWNQIRPGVFDGGYSIQSYFPGGMASGSAETPGLPSGRYIVEVSPPPGYDVVKEEDKNVDFGDEYVPSPQFLPPELVGDLHVVGDVLTLFPGVDCVYAGQTRPLADRKLVEVSTWKNAAADFFLKTDVPKAARAVGFVNNDLSAEFDKTSPIWGEKSAPSWLPISIQDWAGNELGRVYCDEWGSYNAMIPSTYTVNVPAPSGVSPQMVTFVLNHPGPIPDPANPSNMIVDPHYDPSYSTTPWTLHFYPGTTTYLDTPIVPIAAFAGYPNGALDTEPPTGTPVIFSAEGPAGGPVLASAGDTLVIKSVGYKTIPNPDYDPTNPLSPATITRDFGFGGGGTVTINGVAMTVTSWANDQIQAVPGLGATTGTLVVTRTDIPPNKSSDLNLTVHIAPAATVRHVTPAPWPAHPIQDAVDAAAPQDLIVLHPGTYNENVILNKDVLLQGSGAESTIINGNPQPAERVSYWHNKIQTILGTDPFAANECPGIMVLGNAGFAQNSSGIIDGLSTVGSLAGGGIYINSLADYQEIRNCKVQGNQGSWGGGITVGTPQATDKSTNVNIHHNYVIKNGGIQGPGGIAIYAGADMYMVHDNLIMGNFSRDSGGGIGHIGVSLGGLIEHNRIVSNEVFFGQLVPGGGDGGGIFVGSEPPTTTGSGSVTINANLIQGNLAGAGSGGAIRALMVNGADVAAAPGDPDQWYSLNIFNNMIVNNVAGYAAGGISLQDAAKAVIVNNTIVHNDSTATAALAFPPGNLLQSTPQGAGIVSFAHSAVLAASSGQQFSDPILHDNIIWRNSSFSWDGTLNGSVGGLVANPAGQYQDLMVSGVAGALHPEYCVLSDTTGYALTNTASLPAFVEAYTNNLLTAAVLDEGGNAITVRFKPIGIHGDYHTASGSSALELGGGLYVYGFPELHGDYDGDIRLYVTPDSGADQVSTTPWSLPPVINSVTATPASILDSQTSQLLATATDPDFGPNPLTYAWTAPAGGGSFSDPTIANPVYIPPYLTSGSQTYTLQVEVSDGLNTVTGTVGVTVTYDPVIIDTHFETNTSGFTYRDDAFRGTTQPNYASGFWSNGQSALVVDLGNVDNSTVSNMSGGWQRSFSTANPTTVNLTLLYWFRMDSAYDAGEYGEVLVAIDGTLVPGAGPDYVYRENAVDGGGPTIPTGWVTFTYSQPLPAGSHTITVGAFNNHKDGNNESLRLRVGQVQLMR